MSSVIQPAGAELAFFESQKLPSKKRGMTFEALFYRQLHQVTARIHETENVEQIMLETSQEICKLLNADRLTLYAVSEDQTSIVSKIKTGLNSSRDLKLPISPQSLAGYAAYSKAALNLNDVYDEEALRRIHPSLSFLKEVDKRSGYRTKQMLVAPIMDGPNLHGVLQVINNKNDEPFGDLEVDGVTELCKTLATAIRQRLKKASDSGGVKKASKFDGLVADGLLTEPELRTTIEEARAEGLSIEAALISGFGLSPALLGAALAKFFGVAYEPFNAGRIRSEMLHGALKREFIVEQGWIPLEESPEGLVIMCLDPEAVRGSRVVPQVFPRSSKFAYRVTTQTEFKDTLAQLFGASVDSSTIDQLLADMDGAPIDDGSNDDSLESAAADNELVKFVNKVIIDAYNQKVSDIHIEPMPGKLKTGIRFRIDGTLVPYVEVPAHFPSGHGHAPQDHV
ncbi:GAF domain-containing protein [Rhodoferax sp.]|uniref:ATPase, T2SS/T4P/T4SS family n=1 Tax=Rhodoferax sp. TaxID=50421 RepID=UPI002ACED3AC|nr:GAF domain-containing protein [Rhodoferax sp.]MDZ7920968.1 GAF domain-containing protein [Rhodoferax sp.]